MNLSLVSLSLLAAIFILLLKPRTAAVRISRGGAAGLALLWCIFSGVSVSAQSTYRDPGGAYTVSAPAGWKAEKEQDSNQVTLTKGDVAVAMQVTTIDDGSTPKPREVLDAIEKQMRQDPCTDVTHRGNTAVAGAAGEYFLITCTIAGHGDMGDTVAVAVANGKLIIVTTSAVPAQFEAAMADIQTITKSFRVMSGSAGRGRGAAEPSGPSRGNGGDGGAAAGPNAQKLQALEQACALGVMPPSECDAKRAALMGGGDSPAPANPSVDRAKLQALEGLCRTGVYTPEDCAAKRAALMGQGGNPVPGGGNGPRPSGYESRPGANGGASGGSMFRDPQGAFSLTIPRGWEAKAEPGCYGPQEACPQGAGGVNIRQGQNWVFIAPISAKVSGPKDVVSGVAGDYQSGYKNFKMTQNDEKQINGVDVAFATFTGVDQGGVPVSMIIAGVAAPNGQYFVVASSMPQNAPQTTSDDLDTMVNSLRFGGGR